MINDSREKLHEELCSILGSRNVYFQPPESIELKYPAIIYSRSDIENTHAGNKVYNQFVKYKVTIVDYEVDNDTVQKLSTFEFAVYDRHYNVNGLSHDQFTISYKKQ